ncbi:MAG: hypothetical protein GY754_25415 [bacterium]|nr:hypothetical protein [bacterium]
MSGYEGHMKGGLVSFGILFFFLLIFQLIFGSFALVEFPLFFGLCLFGAMWPDSDIGSKSRIVVYIIFLIIDCFLIFFLQYYREAAIFGLFAMLPAISKHRGWTHSIPWILVVGLPLLAPSFIFKNNDFLVDVKIHTYRNLIYAGVPYYLSFLVGAASHLVLDRADYFKKKRSKAKKVPKAANEGTAKTEKEYKAASKKTVVKKASKKGAKK